MKRRSAVAIVLLASSILLGGSGCARMQNADRANSLGESVRFYVKAMRWGEYRAALGMMRGLDGEPLELPAWQLEQLSSIDVISVDEEVTDVDMEQGTAKMAAGYRYHLGDATRIDDATQEGIWWYDDESEGWFLDGGLPTFGQ